MRKEYRERSPTAYIVGAGEKAWDEEAWDKEAWDVSIFYLLSFLEPALVTSTLSLRKSSWRAGCGESCKSGSEGDSWKRTERYVLIIYPARLVAGSNPAGRAKASKG